MGSNGSMCGGIFYLIGIAKNSNEDEIKGRSES